MRNELRPARTRGHCKVFQDSGMRLNRKKIARVAAYSTLTPRSPLGVDNDVSHAARRLGEG